MKDNPMYGRFRGGLLLVGVAPPEEPSVMTGWQEPTPPEEPLDLPETTRRWNGTGKPPLGTPGFIHCACSEHRYNPDCPVGFLIGNHAPGTVERI